LFKIDPNTGLAELPEGYFWRVKLCTNPFSDAALELELRKRVLRIFSTEIDFIYTTQKRLGEAANALASSFYRESEDRMYSPSILGDYPPKKLVTND